MADPYRTPAEMPDERALRWTSRWARLYIRSCRRLAIGRPFVRMVERSEKLRNASLWQRLREIQVRIDLQGERIRNLCTIDAELTTLVSQVLETTVESRGTDG